jgi:hypothetical protein
MTRPTPSPRRGTQELPRDSWVPFLDQFTRENRGAHARLEIVGGEAGSRVETEDSPFDGISADVKDREHTIWITLGTNAADHLTHGVHARTIRTGPPDGNGGAVLEIEADDGSKTVLELSNPGAYAIEPGGTADRK